MTHIQQVHQLASAVLAMLLFSQTASAQQNPPAIQWQKSLGGGSSDYAFSIVSTSDGGYVAAGWSSSTDGDVTGNHGGYDYWIVKLTSAGVIEWQKSLGGSNVDYAYSIAPTSDGGYIVAGNSSSTDGDVTGHHGSSDSADAWVVKLTSDGNIEWQKSLGGSADDYAYSIAPTSDGGHIVAGESHSTNGDVTGNHGGSDYWIVKLTSVGEIEWQKSLGGSADDYAYSIAPTSDGGYIVAGRSSSTDGDIIGNHGSADSWIVKLTSVGKIEWQKSLGGSSGDYAYSIAPTSDGGYIVAGGSSSTDGDVTQNYGAADYWIAKLTRTGVIEWQKSLGGSQDDVARLIVPTNNGGYMVAGWSHSNDSGVIGHYGSSNHTNYWIVKLTSMGDIEWQRSLGGSREDYARSIAPTSDGGYIIGGYSNSTDSDVSGHHGSTASFDYWIVKLAPATSSAPTLQPQPAARLSAITVQPNPAQNTALLTLTSDAEAEYTIELISPVGEVVRRQSVHLGIGQQEVHLQDIEQLPAGSYEVVASRRSQPFARGKLVLLGE